MELCWVGTDGFLFGSYFDCTAIIHSYPSIPGSQYFGTTQDHAARLKRRIHPLEADSAPPASLHKQKLFVLFAHALLLFGWHCVSLNNPPGLRIDEVLYSSMFNIVGLSRRNRLRLAEAVCAHTFMIFTSRTYPCIILSQYIYCIYIYITYI